MRVLITHEESGIVREAFRKRGHDAWSNDLISARDGSPHHLQMCAKEAIVNHGPWDIIISHVECTEMAVSGNRWYGKGTAGYSLREAAIAWAVEFWDLARKHAIIGCAIENPVSVLWQHIGKPQYIQLWQYGHKETKRTGILTDRLPPLEPTKEKHGKLSGVWPGVPPEKGIVRRQSKVSQMLLRINGEIYVVAGRWCCGE